MEGGVAMADEMGAEMCVEASVVGKYLYEQNGFRVTENVEVPVPGKWKGKPKIESIFMRRPVTTQVSKLGSGETLQIS